MAATRRPRRLFSFATIVLATCLAIRQATAFSILTVEKYTPHPGKCHPHPSVSSSANSKGCSRFFGTSSALLASSRGGIGMGVKNNKKKNTKSKSIAPFDAASSLARLEKLYDKLLLDAAKRLQNDQEDDIYDDDNIVTTEYVIAARDKTAKIVQDWCPVAQLCLARSSVDAHASEGSSLDRKLIAAVSSYCREISHVAGLGSRVFPSIPRHDLEYAVETVDSFHKHVYSAVIETSSRRQNSGSAGVSGGMTKEEARVVLQIDSDEDCSLREIKNKYRKRSFEYHPDRVSQRDLTEAETREAAEEYSKIKVAYEMLSSPSEWARKNGSSWYESLGGRARTDFVGPVNLMSISDAQADLDLQACQSAIVGLDPAMVQAFIARSRAAGPPRNE